MNINIHIVAAMRNTYKDGFKYPEDFVAKLLNWQPIKENEISMAQLFHQAVAANDRLVGRFLDDFRQGGDKTAALLYREWCKIDDQAPKHPIENEGFLPGFAVREIEK